MAFSDPYVTADNFKLRYNVTETKWDAVIESILKAASRQIDRWTGRTFNNSGTAEARYFTPTYSATPHWTWGSVIYPGDLVSIASMEADDSGDASYSTDWDVADLVLYPRNPKDGWPYDHIGIMPNVSMAFPLVSDGVRITGVFGWPSVPDAIVEATYIEALRLFKRQSAPFGVVGSADMGQLRAIVSMDPDVKALIQPYKVKTV